jgi:hypothetical protein
VAGWRIAKCGARAYCEFEKTKPFLRNLLSGNGDRIASGVLRRVRLFYSESGVGLMLSIELGFLEVL